MSYRNWQVGDSVLDRALAQRTELIAQLRAVDRFITDYRAFEAGRAPQPQTQKRGSRIPGQSALARAEIAAILQDAGGGPLRSVDIATEMERRNTTVRAANLRNYVPSIVHRNQDIFERTERGYRLRQSSKQGELA